MLMEFYASGRRAGTFDDGIEKALRRLLADPEFVYRREVAPATVPAGGTYRISDLALASRLSFFLWSSMPDDELLTLAEQGRLREPAMLEKQVRRMVADPKSAALIDNFAGQWLNLRALATIAPNPSVYPDFDDNLRRRVSPRGRAPVRQHRPRGPQRPGSADRGLHVRRRTARPPLRDPERLRQPVPARDSWPRPRHAAWAAREGRLDERDVAGHENLAGHPRQGVPGNLPRRESSVPAAERAA